mmetsp:Transcript_1437/g.2911  ORF Transcript_1437/g.2911 Transcript_1437/m.2911 type:complete len:211 (+) Transcript_1437:2494-3126(+)
MTRRRGGCGVGCVAAGGTSGCAPGARSAPRGYHQSWPSNSTRTSPAPSSSTTVPTSPGCIGPCTAVSKLSKSRLRTTVSPTATAERTDRVVGAGSCSRSASARHAEAAGDSGRCRSEHGTAVDTVDSVGALVVASDMVRSSALGVGKAGTSGVDVSGSAPPTKHKSSRAYHPTSLSHITFKGLSPEPVSSSTCPISPGFNGPSGAPPFAR